MLQYLINTTAIWLISLVLFDVFLRRETYHAYNRLYLLGTFLLGLLLPLWDSSSAKMYELPALQPVQRVTEVRQNIVTAASASSLNEHISWWLWAYVAGVLVVLVILAIDTFKLIRLYKAGTISYEDGLMIVETGQAHTPFSFLKAVFVESRARYSAEEWQTVIAHERRHATLGHFADVLLMQLARAAFWFHPLAYLYNNRLLTVHEYQADRESALPPRQYGQFLIEQALLQTSPVIAHSFNRSPIKNRIIMLSRKSSTVAKFKMLVLIPLALVSFICFSQKVIARNFTADKFGFVRLGNNQFEFSRADADTIEVEMEDGTMVKKIVKQDPHALKMDGRPILDMNPAMDANGSPVEYLCQKMKGDFLGLEDGFYFLGIANVIVDEKGKGCGFTYQGINGSKLEDNSQPAKAIKLEKKVEEKLFNRICNELAAFPKWQPPVVKGKKVISASSLFGGTWLGLQVKVERHKVYVKSGKTWVEL